MTSASPIEVSVTPDDTVARLAEFVDWRPRLWAPAVRWLLGDLSLLGSDLVAHVIATRSGHATNAELVRRLTSIVHERENSGLLEREPAVVRIDGVGHVALL